jgi:hypothetical protein
MRIRRAHLKNPLPVPRKHVARAQFHAFELFASCRNEDPVTIVQMQNGGRWNNRISVRGLTLKRCGDKLAEPQHPRIGNFDPHLRGANIRVEHRANVADMANQYLPRIGICLDGSFLSQLKLRNVILVDIANDPDDGKISDGEGGGRPGIVTPAVAAFVTFCAMMTLEMGA